MPKVVKLQPWGSEPVPLGRLHEALIMVQNPTRTTTRQSSKAWDSGYIIEEWPSREAMAAKIRQLGKQTNDVRYRPVVALSATDGY